MIFTNRSFVVIAFLLVLHTGLARAAAGEDAESVITNATKSIYQAIQEQCSEIEKDPLHLHKLVEDILIPHADFKRMAQLALGRYWRTADPALLPEFVAQFRHLLIRTYATAVQMASLEAIQYLPSRPGTKQGTIVIRTEVRRPGEPMVTINYYLLETKGQWLVYDIHVDGISLVANYRSTFSEQISKDGFPALVDTLEKKNQQPLPGDSADLIRSRAARACKQANL